MKPKLHTAKVLANYRVQLSYSDGVTGTVDFSGYVGKGVFASWNDYAFFTTAQVGQDGQLAWGDDIDFCGDALYLIITNQSAESLFPTLNHEYA